MLDFHRIQDDLATFSTYQVEERARQAERRVRAGRALAACASSWQALRDLIDEAEPKELVAGLRADPAAAHDAPARPSPVTVVATDGSQIYPDRHVEPTCFLLNISRIAFHYGTDEPPVLDAVPRFYFRGDETAASFDAVQGAMTTEVVSARRDAWELGDLLTIARAARAPGRPLLALADGTLIRWMVRGMRNPVLEEQLIEEYTALLEAFRDDELPLASYISMPGNTEVVNLLRAFLGELDDVPAAPPADLAGGEPLTGLLDRLVFADLLPPGARSACFTSASHIQERYPTASRIAYAYVHVPGPRAGIPGEIGRLEMPAWVADDPALVDLAHAVVLSECAKGDGYPLALGEAHERAVIRAPEREAFFQLLDRTLSRAGLPPTGSRKRQSKRVARI